MLDLSFENKYFKQGYNYVIGIDEVGRGCWAGPMYMCAYIQGSGTRSQELGHNRDIVAGVKDSKKISKLKREKIYQELVRGSYIVEKVTSREIDRIGLGEAVIIALKNLIEIVSDSLKPNTYKLLVDGYFKGEWPKEVEFVIKGDSKSYSIAAASIIAKVERDRYMEKMAKKYPDYGFENHVGYGTKEHRLALELYGVSNIHRKSYKPISKLIA